MSEKPLDEEVFHLRQAAYRDLDSVYYMERVRAERTLDVLQRLEADIEYWQNEYETAQDTIHELRRPDITLYRPREEDE
jgi:hypothetical protein